jgi:hypothetical protein
MSLHDTSSVSQCGASPDALKMPSQSCCEVHLDSAKSKSIDVRAGQERALVLLTAEQNIQENFIHPTLTHESFILRFRMASQKCQVKNWGLDQEGWLHQTRQVVGYPSRWRPISCLFFMP